MVAPVGDAWERNYQSKQPFRLHVADNSHPDFNGTYLAALVDLYGPVMPGVGFGLDFKKARGIELTGVAVANHILRDRDNPVSVLAMIEYARSNARSVRTALTREVWEATNESWMVLRELMAKPLRASNLGEVLAAVRRQSTLVRGAMDGTMLRNEIFNFARIGTFIERADNTARILDVKYYVLLPSVSLVGSSLDNAQWEMILRSVSGETAYRWLHAGAMDARGIASFLMLDERFPRSLAFCYDSLRINMAGLAREYGGESHSHGLMRNVGAKLHGAEIDGIIEYGLHQFIGDFLKENRAVADAVASDYRFTH